MDEEEVKLVDSISDSNTQEEPRAIHVQLSFQNDKITIHLNKSEETKQIDSPSIASRSTPLNAQYENNIFDVNQVTKRLTCKQTKLTAIKTIFEGDDIDIETLVLLDNNDRGEIREEDIMEQNNINDFGITNRRKHQKLTGDQLMHAKNTIINSNCTSKELSNKLCLSDFQINRMRRACAMQLNIKPRRNFIKPRRNFIKLTSKQEKILRRTINIFIEESETPFTSIEVANHVNNLLKLITQHISFAISCKMS